MPHREARRLQHFSPPGVTERGSGVILDQLSSGVILQAAPARPSPPPPEASLTFSPPPPSTLQSGKKAETSNNVSATAMSPFPNLDFLIWLLPHLSVNSTWPWPLGTVRCKASSYVAKRSVSTNTYAIASWKQLSFPGRPWQEKCRARWNYSFIYVHKYLESLYGIYIRK